MRDIMMLYSGIDIWKVWEAAIGWDWSVRKQSFRQRRNSQIANCFFVPNNRVLKSFDMALQEVKNVLKIPKIYSSDIGRASKYSLAWDKVPAWDSQVDYQVSRKYF